MADPYALSTLWVLVVALLAVIAAIAAFRLRPKTPSRVITTIVVLPSLLMLALFYSLAVHMHHSLSAWPSSIGEDGFPASLLTHAHLAEGLFMIMFLFSFLAWPIIFILCRFIPRWKSGIFYSGIYAFSCLLCLGAMLLAPSQFLLWWWD